jgi:hypothetical protein
MRALLRNSSLGWCLIALPLLGYAAHLDSDQDGQWKFVVAPYLWGTNLSGNTQMGAYNAPVNESFGDILKQLNFAGMLYLSIAKDNFGAFLDTIYSQTSTTTSYDPVNIKSTNDYGILTLAATYLAYKTHFNHSSSMLAVTPYVGARETIDNTTIKLSYGDLSDSVSSNHHWVDPIVGARIDYQINPTWSLVVFADGGGTNTNTNYNYRFSGLAGYKLPSFKTARIYAGYQYLREKYLTGSGRDTFEWNMKTYGPVLGISVTF